MRPIFLTVAAMIGAAASAQTQPAMVNAYGRQHADLGGLWSIVPDYQSNGYYRQIWLERTPQGKDDFYEASFDGAQQIMVPGDFNTQVDQMLHSECPAWYKRTLTHSKSHPDNRLFLYFGAVNYRAEVYLDGVKIGEHEGGYTPFQIEVPDSLPLDDTSLVMMADNRRSALGLPAEGFDWFGYGGITRDVMLVETPPSYVDDYFVRLDGDKVRVTAHVDGEGGGAVSVSIPELRISKTLELDGEGVVDFAVKAKPELWSPSSPRLYDVVIAYAGDTIRDRIGFRTIETRGRQVLLNGEPIFLKGVNIHEERLRRDMSTPSARACTPDDDRRLLETALDLGCNIVRLAHYPHNEHMVRLAEEMGLMVWDEIPVYQGIAFSSEGVPEKIEAAMADMVRRDKNRAAVVIWSLSNETWPSYEGRTEVLSSLTCKCRALDDTRLITHVINTQGYDDNTFNVWDPLYEACDLICLNEYIGWYIPWQGAPADLRWKLPNDKPVFVSEFGGEARYGSDFGPKDAAGYWSEEFQAEIYRRQIEMFDASADVLCGVCPWILADYVSLGRMHPVYQGGYNRKGLVDEFGRRKQAYYLMRDYYHRAR